jgi:hypothetical protein
MAGELRWKQRSPDAFNHRVTTGCDLTGSRQLFLPMATKDRDLLRLEDIGCRADRQTLDLGLLFLSQVYRARSTSVQWFGPSLVATLGV